MENTYKVGDNRVAHREYEAGVHVIFVDPYGVRRGALVTTWHCSDNRDEWLASQQVNRDVWASRTPPVDVPITETCCNLVWISGDEKRTDSHGRQLMRESSVVHKGSQPAHGNYWMWPDE